MSRHRATIRVTPLGYMVLGILVLVLTVGIIFIAWSMKNAGQATSEPPGSPSAAPQQTPTLAPINPGLQTYVPSLPNTTSTPNSPAYQADAATPTPTPSPTPRKINGVEAPTADQIHNAVDGKLTASGVAFRKGPDTSYSILDKYDEGTALKVFNRQGDYYFCQIVKEDERYGYFAVKFITKFGLLPGEEASPTPALNTNQYLGIVVAKKGVALRAVPATTGNSPIGECAKGDSLIVYFQTGDFYYVEVPATGRKAYAFAAYISVNGSVPQGTPIP